MIDTMTYRAMLEAALDELTAELTTIGIHDPKNPQNWIALPDAADGDTADIDLVADAVENADERQALVAAFETRYNNLTRALAKLDVGTYGVCEICKKEIEEDRLGASPEARTCKSHMDDEETLGI